MRRYIRICKLFNFSKRKEYNLKSSRERKIEKKNKGKERKRKRDKTCDISQGNNLNFLRFLNEREKERERENHDNGGNFWSGSTFPSGSYLISSKQIYKIRI